MKGDFWGVGLKFQIFSQILLLLGAKSVGRKVPGECTSGEKTRGKMVRREYYIPVIGYS